MNKINKICIITDFYPTEKVPKYTFVEQLVLAWAKIGIECTVLTPSSLTHVLIRGAELKPKEKKVNYAGNIISVYSPRYVSYSMKKIGKLNFAKYSIDAYINCCMKFIKKNKTDYDVFYGHFIHNGIVAAQLSEKYEIPAFFAYGENTTYSIDYLGDKKTKELIKSIRGAIAVSTVNKNILVEKKLVKSENIEVIPNAVDKSIFFPREKYQMREKYGFEKNDFIIAFVGYFIHIKGPDRLSNAIKKLQNDNIKSIFIGEGKIKPSCEGIIFEGRKSRNEIAEMLSASDIFVLPTIAEGCCNAIIEAMSCGLPIVSSKESFNNDLLDESCSIRVDSMNVQEIANAIAELYSDKKLRQKLSEGAIAKSAKMEINYRARNIIEFIETKI